MHGVMFETDSIHKQSIEHAGYQRNILRRNPMRYDADGDELDDEDSDAEADARAAEENPYAEIHLEGEITALFFLRFIC